MDCSLPGSSVHGIFQARVLEWGATAFSRPLETGALIQRFITATLLLLSRFSHVRLLATPWTAAYQAPPSMGFSRQEYWSGVPLPSPSGFPYFLQFKFEFGNKEFMI